jgi:glycosyltransferase involved in cell wall biosynthesis
MRILHVVGKLDRGGAETWLVQTLRHIDRSKYQFDFLVHTEEPGAYDDEVRALGARVIPCVKPSNPVKYARNFLRVLKKYGPYDCVHSHVRHFSGVVLLLARIRKIPVRIVHSHSDTRLKDQKSGYARRIYLSSMNKLLRTHATSGLAVSRSAAESLFGKKWDEDGRWRICLPGIDLVPFSCPVNRDAIRAQLGIPEDAFVLGHVGRFSPSKNHRLLVSIAENVCRTKPKSIFLLVGDGPLRDSIENLVRSAGLTHRFIFTGARNDVPALLQGAMDAFIFPSLFEGLGLGVIEAQSAGLPCFISSGVPNEAVIPGSRVSRFAADASAREWADAIVRTDRLSRVDKPLLSLKDYSIERATERLCSAYEEPTKSFCNANTRHISVSGVGASK